MKEQILRLISGGHALKLKASDGSRLIHQAKNTFEAYIDSNFVNWGMNKPGVATPEILAEVHEMVSNGTFMGIFSALPGCWNEKCIPQDKVVDFCETLPDWLRQEEFGNFFLVKKDEAKPVDEKNPSENLAVVAVSVNDVGLHVFVFRLEYARVWNGEYRHRVVSPQLMPLEA
jgi:hypothetical protein